VVWHWREAAHRQAQDRWQAIVLYFVVAKNKRRRASLPDAAFFVVRVVNRILQSLRLPLDDARYLPPLMAGNISLTIVIAAGPTSTMKMAGKMNSTSGKISFTAVFAAFSSAI
jgi:hypothetical protein